MENNLLSPRPFASITNEELGTYAGVFIPGGHAPLTDLGDNAELGRILHHFHNTLAPTGMFSLPLPAVSSTELVL
jgi:putative intracellular protease/amidase